MPIVHIEMWPGRTQEQKAELAKVLTEAMVSIVHTPAQEVIVVFQEVAKSNWAKAGQIASESG
jgi:4-oxalocrotonate tautomerase